MTANDLKTINSYGVFGYFSSVAFVRPADYNYTHSIKNFPPFPLVCYLGHSYYLMDYLYSFQDVNDDRENSSGCQGPACQAEGR